MIFEVSTRLLGWRCSAARVYDSCTEPLCIGIPGTFLFAVKCEIQSKQPNYAPRVCFCLLIPYAMYCGFCGSSFKGVLK